MTRLITTVLIGLAFLALLVMLIVFVRDYGAAPATVPVHFGVDGAPNRWGPKSTFLVFPILGVVFLGLAAAVLTFGLPSASTPIPPALPILTGLAFVEALWMLAFAELGTFDVALGRAGGLGLGFFVGLGLVISTGVAVVIVAFFTLRRQM
jgi:uncharacterized protein DUF1648